MNKKIILPFLLALLTAFVGCDPEDEVEIGDPGSKLEGINADWVIAAVQIVDNNSINGDSISVTSYFGGDDAAEISFDSDNFTYTVNAQGKRNFFGTGGGWSFDDNEAPTMITLTTEDGDIIELTLTSTIRPQDQRLRVNYARNCGDAAYATYYFEYQRK